MDGDLNVVENDSETKDTQNKINKFLSAINSIPSISENFSSFKDVFKSIFKKSDEDEDEEGGDTLFDSIKNFFSDDFIGKIKDVLNILKIGAAATAIIALTGALDPILQKLGITGSDKLGYKDDIAEYTDEEGNTKQATVHKGNKYWDDNGNVVNSGDYVDENGNKVDGTEINLRKNGADSASSIMYKGTARQLLLKEPTLIGKSLNVLKNHTKIGKFVGRVGGNIGNIAGGLIKNTKAYKVADFGFNKTYSKGLQFAKVQNLENQIYYTEIINTIKEKLPNILKKLPIIGKKLADPDNADEAAKLYDKLAKKIVEYIEKGGSKVGKFMNVLDDIVVPLKIITVIMDFTTGYEDARNTLGITKDPTLVQRCVSGLLRVLKNLIPLIGPFIPDKVIVDVLFDHIYPLFGVTDTDIQKDRDEAQAEVDA